MRKGRRSCAGPASQIGRGLSATDPAGAGNEHPGAVKTRCLLSAHADCHEDRQDRLDAASSQSGSGHPGRRAARRVEIGRPDIVDPIKARSSKRKTQSTSDFGSRRGLAPRVAGRNRCKRLTRLDIQRHPMRIPLVSVLNSSLDVKRDPISRRNGSALFERPSDLIGEPGPAGLQNYPAISRAPLCPRAPPKVHVAGRVIGGRLKSPKPHSSVSHAICRRQHTSQNGNPSGLPQDLPFTMSNLHAPTIPSGPTTRPVANGVTHLSFTELQHKKDNVEAELKALGSVLDSVSSPTPYLVAQLSG